MAPLYLLPVGGAEGQGEAAISLLYPTSARYSPPSEGQGEV